LESIDPKLPKQPSWLVRYVLHPIGFIVTLLGILGALLVAVVTFTVMLVILAVMGITFLAGVLFLLPFLLVMVIPKPKSMDQRIKDFKERIKQG